MGFVDVGIIFEHFVSLQVKMFRGLAIINIRQGYGYIAYNVGYTMCHMDKLFHDKLKNKGVNDVDINNTY